MRHFELKKIKKYTKRQSASTQSSVKSIWSCVSSMYLPSSFLFYFLCDFVHMLGDHKCSMFCQYFVSIWLSERLKFMDYSFGMYSNTRAGNLVTWISFIKNQDLWSQLHTIPHTYLSMHLVFSSCNSFLPLLLRTSSFSLISPVMFVCIIKETSIKY